MTGIRTQVNSYIIDLSFNWCQLLFLNIILLYCTDHNEIQREPELN